MAIADQGQAGVRAYLEYFRDLGIHDFYRADFHRAGAMAAAAGVAAVEDPAVAVGGANASYHSEEKIPAEEKIPGVVQGMAATASATVPADPAAPTAGVEFDIAKLISLNDLAPLPERRVAGPKRAAALAAIHAEIGDCTRCPLAYGGRHTIVFGNGDPKARLMFVGEGPGADEDEQGLPFVGKSGQLLNNMIGAMGLTREQVYVANIVKCRPPANRAPEPIEANTCTQFLVQQMDVVQPEVVVALGTTAAMYLLGVKQSLASLRGRWHAVRGAKAAVTYHPAFLLRDPRQKGEAWKDLQMVMAEMGLKGKG